MFDRKIIVENSERGGIVAGASLVTGVVLDGPGTSSQLIISCDVVHILLQH